MLYLYYNEIYILICVLYICVHHLYIMLMINYMHLNHITICIKKYIQNMGNKNLQILYSPKIFEYCCPMKAKIKTSSI